MGGDAMFIGHNDLTFGLFAGFMTGFTFLSMALGVTYLFEHRSLKLWLINAGYQIVIRKPARITFVSIAFCILVLPARAEVKDASPSGFSIENSAVVAVDPSTAWQALVGSADSWWPKDHTWWGRASKLTIDARAGGCFCEIAGAQQAQHMQVVFADPPSLLRMTGGLGPLQGMGLSGVLEWRLTPTDGGTRITLWYRAGGYTPDDMTKFATAVDSVQKLQLGGLANYLRNRTAKPIRQP
jgi:uncharacterized protein YndB with AHSA1/START domain